MAIVYLARDLKHERKVDPDSKLVQAMVATYRKSGVEPPDEYYVIEASNPKVAGIDGAVKSYVDFLYSLA